MQVAPSPPPPRLRSVFVPVPQQEPKKSASTPAVSTVVLVHQQGLCMSTPSLHISTQCYSSDVEGSRHVS
jgi:hypothetical protein